MPYASQFWIALYGNLKRKDVPDGEWVLYAEPRESWQGLGVTPLPCEFDRPAFGRQGVGAQFCMLLLLVWNDHVFMKDMVHTMSWWLICTWLGVHESHIFHLRETTWKRLTAEQYLRGCDGICMPSLLYEAEIPDLVLVQQFSSYTTYRVH